MHHGSFRNPCLQNSVCNGLLTLLYVAFQTKMELLGCKKKKIMGEMKYRLQQCKEKDYESHYE